MAKNAADTSQLLGTWAIETRYLEGVLADLQAVGRVKALDEADLAELAKPERKDAEGNVAVISIGGPMTKHPHIFQLFFGGTATTEVRDVLAAVAADPKVEAIVLAIDSPGGTVAGSVDLAEDVAKVSQKKPVVAYIEDLGASAAYWVASQTNRIVANKAAHIGSIGVFAVIHDLSAHYERAGVKVHVVSTGEYKGSFVPGTKVTEKQLAAVQANVDAINTMFIEAVAQGRGLTTEQVAKLADGRVHVGQRNVELGLADSIGGMDDAIAEARTLAQKRKKGAYAENAAPAPVVTAMVPTGAAALNGTVADLSAGTGASTVVATTGGASGAGGASVSVSATQQNLDTPSNPAPEKGAEISSGGPPVVETQTATQTPPATVAAAPAPDAALLARIEALEKREAEANARALAAEKARLVAEYGLAEADLAPFTTAEQVASFERIVKNARSTALPRDAPPSQTPAEKAEADKSEQEREAFLKHCAARPRETLVGILSGGS